jgi:hypothetical protein
VKRTSTSPPRPASARSSQMPSKRPSPSSRRRRWVSTAPTYFVVVKVASHLVLAHKVAKTTKEPTCGGLRWSHEQIRVPAFGGPSQAMGLDDAQCLNCCQNRELRPAYGSHESLSCMHNIIHHASLSRPTESAKFYIQPKVNPLLYDICPSCK